MFLNKKTYLKQEVESSSLYEILHKNKSCLSKFSLQHVCTFLLTVEAAAFLCTFLFQRRCRQGAWSVYAHDGKASYMKVHILPDQGNLLLHC